MKINDAINHLTELKQEGGIDITDEENDAIGMGIEALKWYKNLRAIEENILAHPLPGESR